MVTTKGIFKRTLALVHCSSSVAVKTTEMRYERHNTLLIQRVMFCCLCTLLFPYYVGTVNGPTSITHIGGGGMNNSF